MRVILLVLDALGVGEMPDVPAVRPQDQGANTLMHLLQNVGDLHLDNLQKLGLGKIISWGALESPSSGALASYGRSRLAHFGADSYLGHQEILGTIPMLPRTTLLRETADSLQTQLQASNHTVTRPVDGKCLLLVDDAVVIGDNLEADPGLNLNLTVPTDLIPFDAALKIGRIVRAGVQVSRVIVFGGPGIDVSAILSHVKLRANGQIGVDSPSLGVYNERLHVQHLGYGVDPDRQAASILSRKGIQVVLIGKMADLIFCPGATKNPVVPTPQVMEAVLDSYRETPDSLIAATVQETDLAAHQGDMDRIAGALEQVDQALGVLLAEMGTEDVLIICADHGNDPLLNIGLHTREETPLLVYQKGQRARPLGVRTTLADIGATVTRLFHAPPTQDGSIIRFRRNLRFQILTPEEVEIIHAASAVILSKTGVRFGSQKALEIFAAAGAQVDFNQELVRIPEALLEQVLQTKPNHFRLWNRGGDQSIDLQDGQIRGHNVGGCVRIFDIDTGEGRAASQGDLEKMTSLLDALDNIHVVRPVVYPKEFPAHMWDIYTAATILRFTEKPYGVTAYSLENLAYILELTSVLAGSLEQLIAKPFIWGSVCPDSPLYYTKSTADILIRYAEIGLPLAIAPCPVSGASGPVTLAGTLVQLNAEFLAGLALAQIIQPGLATKYTGRPMPMNMQKGNATFGSIEMGMMSAALVQLSKRYHVCSDSYGLGTRSKYLDEQSGYEKSLNGILVGLSGADLIAAAGLLEDALTSSVEQLVIDNEILGMIMRAARGIEITPDTLALETIQNLGPGGSFLSEPHTLTFMRKEYFHPKLVYRSGAAVQQAEDNLTVVNVARDIAESIIKSHQPVQIPEETQQEIQRIVDKATASLTSV